MSIPMMIIIALVLGLVIAFFFTASEKAALTSVHFEKYASQYEKNKKITSKKDVFTHKEVRKVAKPKEKKK